MQMTFISCIDISPHECPLQTSSSTIPRIRIWSIGEDYQTASEYRLPHLRVLLFLHSGVNERKRVAIGIQWSTESSIRARVQNQRKILVLDLPPQEKIERMWLGHDSWVCGRMQLNLGKNASINLISVNTLCIFFFFPASASCISFVNYWRFIYEYIILY